MVAECSRERLRLGLEAHLTEPCGAQGAVLVVEIVPENHPRINARIAPAAQNVDELGLAVKGLERVAVRAVDPSRGEAWVGDDGDLGGRFLGGHLDLHLHVVHLDGVAHARSHLHHRREQVVRRPAILERRSVVEGSRGAVGAREGVRCGHGRGIGDGRHPHSVVAARPVALGHTQVKVQPVHRARGCRALPGLVHGAELELLARLEGRETRQ
mmetsp:Transcript_20496/g.59865  ORF Transcript_20496/g.59865 Transcript_20496/m.59865 type:complete len:213 (+) Transcript_20496:742-1380(+)